MQKTNLTALLRASSEQFEFHFSLVPSAQRGESHFYTYRVESIMHWQAHSSFSLSGYGKDLLGKKKGFLLCFIVFFIVTLLDILSLVISGFCFAVSYSNHSSLKKPVCFPCSLTTVSVSQNVSVTKEP